MQIEGYMPQHTTDDTLDAMIHYANKDRTNPSIIDLASRITQGINPADQQSQMVAILHWIQSNLTYVLDHDESNRLFGTEGEMELVKSPTAVLRTGRYDCDCIATFIAAMLMALGIKARFVVIGFHPVENTGPDGFEHVYAQGFDEQRNSWVIIDPVSHPNEREMTLDTRQSKIYDIP